MSGYWEAEWPNQSSVSIALPMGMRYLVPTATVGIIYKLMATIASKSVPSFHSNADMDPSLPADPKELRKIAGCSRKEMTAALPLILEMFDEKDGRLRACDDDIIRYTRPTTRQAISKDAKAAASVRQGMRCVYCGTNQGPFHYDHIFPVAKGGRNDASNIVVACSCCNISKSDRTLVEWVAFLIARNEAENG